MKNNRQQTGPFLAIGTLAAAAFLCGWSAIVLASWLHSLVMPLAWLVLFALACSWFTRRPEAAATAARWSRERCGSRWFLGVGADA